MKQQEQAKIELDFSRLYGFRILDGNTKSVLASKVGQAKGPVQQMLGSKIGGGKVGLIK